jgi:hypothetical protein
VTTYEGVLKTAAGGLCGEGRLAAGEGIGAEARHVERTLNDGTPLL